MNRSVRVASAALALLAVSGLAAGEQPGNNIHPYPLFPFQPVPGRSGMGAPEIEALRTAYDSAREADDLLTQAAILEQIKSESLYWGHPQFLPYPESIEHVRHHSQRYLPPYPIYNQHTLVKNFVLKDHAATRSSCVDVAEPVYWHTQWGQRVATSETRGPLAAYAWKPGQSVDLPIGRLAPRMMYAVRVIGALKTQDVVRKRIIGVEDARDAEKQLVFRFERHVYAWVRNLFDAPGAPYLLAESIAPRNHRNVNLFRRHVALVDVDEGSATRSKTSAGNPSRRRTSGRCLFAQRQFAQEAEIPNRASIIRSIIVVS